MKGERLRGRIGRIEVVGGVEDGSVGESGAVERRGGDGRGGLAMSGDFSSGWLLSRASRAGGNVKVVGGSDAWGAIASSFNG